MTITWQDPVWTQLGADLDFKMAEKKVATDLATGTRVKEEVLETFLSLNLSAITGHTVYLAGRSLWGWETEDIIGWDPLGRIHIFELKKDTINKKVADQLAQYAFKYLFTPPGDFVESRWSSRLDVLAPNGTLELLIAGAWLNERVAKLGFEYVLQRLPEDQRASISYGSWPPSKYWWTKLDDAEKVTLLRSALEARATALYGDGLQAVEDVAKKWRKRLPSLQRPPRPLLQSTRPAVLWFVAPNITADAEEEIRLWRARGLDARPLMIDMREHNDSAGWDVCITRESMPGRDALEVDLFEQARLAAQSNADIVPRFEPHFYQLSPPSKGIRAGDGLAAENPYIDIQEVTAPTWRKLRPGEGPSN